ncbi:chemotaxis protein CheD [bacterium]|nr:chemotaxis protein CheD [bacterium]
MKKIIEVNTGEVKACREETILKSSAIGSCVVITACDSKRKVGAMAHVMLPGRSPKEASLNRTRYAADAIDAMIKELISLKVNKDNIEVCLVGGANVLKRSDDTIGKDNIESVLELLRKNRLKIRAKAVGGTVRRSVSLDVERGSVSYTEADESEKLL